MSSHDLILIGAGGHAHACVEVIESEARFQIAGFVGKAEEMGAVRLGYEVLASDDELSVLATKFDYALITVGQISSAQPRIRLSKLALEYGFLLPTIISPFSRVSPHATLGPGTIVMHGAVVNAGAIVGANCILNTNAVVEHDVLLDDFVHVSTGAIVNGNVAVGEGAFIGSGALIKEGLVLGAACLVGMGTCVRHNVAANARYTGSVGE